MLTLKAIEDTITDDALWLYIEQLLAQRMARMNMRAALLGLQAAAEDGVIFDPDELYLQIVAMAGASGEAWWQQMTNTTREALRQAVAVWRESGETSDDALIEMLEPMFDEARAERIAATETTRFFTDGAVLAMMADDAIGGERWETAQDERVCSICAPRHGLVWPKGQGPECPAHVRCRCAKRPVGWRDISKNPKAWQGQPIAFEVRLG